MSELRYSFRQLAKRPVYTLVAVLILGLSIGANTALFSVAGVTVFQSLPFGHAERLVRIYKIPQSGRPRISPRSGVFRLVKEAQSFQNVVAQRYTTFTLETDNGPERVVGDAVTAGWTATLEVHPILGRTFSPQETARGENAGVVVLSYATWQNRFGGDPAALTRSIRLNGRALRIIGIMPPNFQYPYGAELWVPLNVEGRQTGPWAFNIQARLAAGVTLAQAREELRALTSRALVEVPGFPRNQLLTPVPTKEVLLRDSAGTIFALLAAAGFLLLIVCVNLANLMFARALGRGREFAIRLSLGAPRRRLVWQLLGESLTLALLGAVVGVALANLTTGWMAALVPGRLDDFHVMVRIQPSALLFTIAIAVASAVAFGLAPALHLSSRNPSQALSPGGTRSTGDLRMRRLMQGLIVGELGLALMLLSGAGLMLRELQARESVPVGYAPQGLLNFSASLAHAPYDEPTARIEFVKHAVTALEALPGIASAGAISIFPSHRGNALASLDVEGREKVEGERLLVNHRLISPGFLKTLQVPLLQGRWLRESDRSDTRPVVLVSRTLARQLWADGRAVGHRIRNARSGADGPWMTVVGVVGDVRESGDAEGTWYLPYAQHPASSDASSVVFTVRGSSGHIPDLKLIRAALARIDPKLPVFDAVSAAALLGEALEQSRQAAWLAGFIGAFGLFLAVLGLYGSISHAVTHRTREIGIRMAMGADPRRVLRTILAQGVRLVLLGSLLGLGGSLVLTRLLSGTAVHVDSFDPITFCVSVFTLGLTSLLAVSVPARRAAHIDPLEALRYE